jgi:Ras GTPase-activating-like protein IQGAP2/3
VSSKHASLPSPRRTSSWSGTCATSTCASRFSSGTAWTWTRRVATLFVERLSLRPLSQQSEFEKHLEDVDPQDGTSPDDRKIQQYSNLFFLLQSEPRHIAALCRLVSLSEIDTLLQTVMFTLYGNQYESREEHLLLTMFQSVLSAQFETATDLGTLLRANTPVSRMMTTYTRRGPGQSYLKTVLGERINSLIEHKELNLEINPVKVRDIHGRLRDPCSPPPVGL